ncbi:MAG: PqiC family protein [Desulfuromonadales bacterium]|nr:PqiC family protein [Desulfuromonadales bacterium]
MRTFHYLSLLLLLLLASACVQIKGSTPPSHFFILESITTSPDILSDSYFIIAIELTEFPEHLKRSQIVTRQQNNIIHISEIQRWATPLEDQVLNLIANNLRLLLPESTVVIKPWQINRQVDHTLQISVKKMSGILGQKTDVDIRWQLADQKGAKYPGHYIDQRPIDDSYEGLVKALNRGLEGLSRELARELAKQGS